MQEFLGPVPERVTALDPRHPVTIGPYMNDPDLINNKYQLKLAMDAARRVIPEVFAEYEALSGRRVPGRSTSTGWRTPTSPCSSSTPPRRPRRTSPTACASRASAWA